MRLNKPDREVKLRKKVLLPKYFLFYVCISVVLSSDDEEGQEDFHCQRKVLHCSVSDTVIQKNPKQKVMSNEEEDPDVENIQVGMLHIFFYRP